MEHCKNVRIQGNCVQLLQQYNFVLEHKYPGKKVNFLYNKNQRKAIMHYYSLWLNCNCIIDYNAKPLDASIVKLL